MNGSCAPDIRHGYQSGTSQRTVQVHGLNLGQQQQTEAHQPTVHLQGSSTAWLARLELLAVQPACLKAHPETPLQPGQAAAWQQLQHDILLHLEATLLADAELPAAAVDTAAAAASIDEATVAFQCPEMATASAAAPALPAPVQLQDAELEMIVLTRQMQLLQQQRLSLLQLVLQQQQQQEEDQGALQPAHSSSRPGDESSSSSSSMAGTTARNVRQTTWPVLLNLHTSMPREPTDQTLDCLHLVLLVTSSAHGTTQQRLDAAAYPAAAGAGSTAYTESSTGGTSSAAHATAALEPLPPTAAGTTGPIFAGTVIADVPLLVLPAVAQQEVQQLLLPAMRQEVQAEQQQQLQQAGVLALQQHGLDDFARQVLRIEQAAWQHYCQLAHDMYAVMQLSIAAQAAAAAGVTSTDVVLVQNGAAAGISAGAAAAAADVPAGPAAALAQLAESLLFPLLLPFLAAQGLHNTLNLLLLCLPVELQQQWQQQQLARLQELAAASPALQLQQMEVEVQQQQQQQLDEPQQQLVEIAAASSSSSSMQSEVGEEQQIAETLPAQKPQQQQQQLPSEQSASSSKTEAAAAASKLADWDEAVAAASAAAERQCKQRQEPPAPAVGSRSAAELAAAVGGGVPWYAALTYFADADVEQSCCVPLDCCTACSTHACQVVLTLLVLSLLLLLLSYLAWKHHTLLHVDYVAALFEVFYLVVLLRRMLSEPVAVYYFIFILLKSLPHLPLILGLKQPYLRYREIWLLMVAPITVVCSIIVIWVSSASLAQGQPSYLLPNRAYKAYWSSRGELQTNVLRSFFQHMRLRAFIVYTLVDACISVWVFAQVFGFLAVLERWVPAVVLSIGLSWGVDVYMRRRFAAVLAKQAQQQQGELLSASAAAGGTAATADKLKAA